MYSFTKRPFAAFLSCSKVDVARPRVCPGAGMEPEPTPGPLHAQRFSQKLVFLCGDEVSLLLWFTGQGIVFRIMDLVLNLAPGPTACHAFFAISMLLCLSVS